MEIEKKLEEIKSSFKYLESRNKSLVEENKTLKLEHYKDIELARLGEENEKLSKRLVNSFEITEKDREKINKWLSNHDCPYQHCHTMKIGRPSIVEYRFGIIPGIGYNGYAKCKCGKEFCFYEE